ncbi:KxDL motif-containing protein 1 [Tanacetum coccineum]
MNLLGRLQDSNAVLTHFNDYSEQCFAEVSSDLSTNTRLLKSMKSDLDYVFQKLRAALPFEVPTTNEDVGSSKGGVLL